MSSKKHFFKHQIQRLKNCGSVSGFFKKVVYKTKQRTAINRFGTASFPNEETRRIQSTMTFEYMPKISILVPLFNTPESFLREMIDSVCNQTYQNWELCLADGSDSEHGNVESVCMEYVSRDARVIYNRLEKNEGISGNTNQCFKLATGDYIGLFDHDDILHPCVLFEYVKVINEKNADFIYCDEVTFKNNNINKMITPHFKPDFAIDNLRANNYICHFSCFDRKLLHGMDLFRSEFDGSQDHDMILRVTEKAHSIVHVPNILYYWRSHQGSVASNIYAKEYAIAAAKNAVGDHLRRCGFEGYKVESTKAFPTNFKVSYELNGNPLVSIIIPNKDHYEDLKKCVESVMEKSSYKNFEIIIVENNSTTKEIFDYYDQISSNEKIRIVNFEGAFNYSKINNEGVKASSGEFLILLNNDTEVITPNWIEEMLMFAQRGDVGAVGAKLLHQDGTIQHAGIVLGLGQHRTAGHIMVDYPRNAVGYMGKLCYSQNVSAVTGACLMVEKSKFEQVGGLDETLAVCLNDVDFCLKLRENGYLNVFTPFAELYHFESKSRGFDDSLDKKNRYEKESVVFKARWDSVINAGDPYFNPNLSLDHPDYRVLVK